MEQLSTKELLSLRKSRMWLGTMFDRNKTVDYFLWSESQPSFTEKRDHGHPKREMRADGSNNAFLHGAGGALGAAILSHLHVGNLEHVNHNLVLRSILIKPTKVGEED